MKVELNYLKSLEENADSYYALAKKAKKKLSGLESGINKVKSKLESQKNIKPEKKKLSKKREKKWFEKFHWFFTGNGFLVVGGRDAKSNEQVVKKIMQPNDIYFHADIQGAPHTALKTEGKKPAKSDLEEAASFAAVFSKAWREQLPAIDVYSAKPEQVSKKAPSGESLGTGAFMVYGKRDWFKRAPLNYAVGLKKKGDSFELVPGPLTCVKKNSDFFVEVKFGKDSKGAASKHIRNFFYQKTNRVFEASLDDLNAILPSGSLGVAGKQ